MAEQVQQTTVNTFVRGLLTEATPLTHPKDFSTDELNCELERTGLRRRRKGIEFEDNSTSSSFTVSGGDLVHTQDWKNPGETSGTEFLVLQVGKTLYFYDKGSSPSSGGEKSFSVDLATFNAGTGYSVSEERAWTASVKGRLIVVSPAIEPFFVEYDSSADTISTSKLNPKVRDFDWQGDTSTYFKPKTVSTVSDERKYDTVNSGWTKFALFDHGNDGAYVTENNAYPDLNLPWWAGANAAAEHADDRIFDEGYYKKIDRGTTLIGNGRIILDLFNKDRSSAVADLDVGLTVNLPIEVEPSRFSAVTTFAGRAWFSGLSGRKNSSKVFFSKVIQGNEDIPKFYQIGDPTSELDPDLVDSDGGVINIPEASNIKALFSYGDSVLVFAENGVWEIGGVDSVFKATEFFVKRLTGTEGLYNPAALVNAQGTPLWWSDTAIYTVTSDEVSGRAIGKDLSKQTIQTFWNNIDGNKKLRATGTYDPVNKRVYWLYEKSDETVNYKYNRILILDLQLKAFIPWEFEDESEDTDYVIGLSYFHGFDSISQENNVEVDGEQVQASTIDVVVSSDSLSQQGPTGLKYLVRDGDTGNVTFATIKNTDFEDWGTAAFESYAVATYEFDGDLTTRKNNIYVTCYFGRNPEEGGETLVRTYTSPTSDIKMASICDPELTLTQSGEYEITIPNLGWTPKAARFVAESSAGFTQANGGIGATDGTNQWSVGFKAESSSSERRMIASDSHLWLGIDVQTGATSAAVLKEFIENGMRIQFLDDSFSPTINNPAATFFVVFFGGEDFQSKAGATLVSGEETIHTGFKADAGFFCSPSDLAFDGIGAGDRYFFLSHGYFADTDPSRDPQMACVYWSTDNEDKNSLDPDSNHTRQIVSTDSVARERVEITDEGAPAGQEQTYPSTTPFTISDSGDSSFKINGSNGYIGYFVMNLGDGNAWVDVVDSPTSTGSWSLDNPGFEPFYTEFTSTNMVETDVLEVLTEEGRTGTMSISGVTEEDLFGIAFWIESVSSEGTVDEDDSMMRFRETNGTTVCQEFIVFTNKTEVIGTRGDTPSITSTGVDFNITATESTVRKWPVIFIG